MVAGWSGNSTTRFCLGCEAENKKYFRDFSRIYTRSKYLVASMYISGFLPNSIDIDCKVSPWWYINMILTSSMAIVCSCCTFTLRQRFVDIAVYFSRAKLKLRVSGPIVSICTERCSGWLIKLMTRVGSSSRMLNQEDLTGSRLIWLTKRIYRHNHDSSRLSLRC